MEQKRFYFSKGIFLKRYFQKKILSKTIAKVNSSKNSLDERKKKDYSNGKNLFLTMLIPQITINLVITTRDHQQKS